MKSVVHLAERSSCVLHIQHVKDVVARAATEEFLARHPDWLERYGERARSRGIEDAGFHIDFLSGAIEAASPEAFASYARWSTRVLRARGIAPAFVAENLRQIRDLISAAVPDCAALIAEVADAGVDACAADPGDHDDRLDPGPLAQEQRLFTQAAVRGDRRAAAGIALATLQGGASILDLYTGMFEASQREAGRLWERNQISVAEEHMATAVTQYAMARVFGEAALATTPRGRAVVTGVEGDLHQIGANMVADVLALDGWDVRFLGTNVPQRDILNAIDEVRPSIVAISATLLSNLPKALALIEAIREGSGPAPPALLVGGAAFSRTSDIFREMGCDGYAADLQSARGLVDRLFPQPPSRL